MSGTPEPDPGFDQEWQKLLEVDVEFADNPEPRCPCVLLLDTSGSMRGAPIQALTAGLAALGDELRKDSLARRRVEVAVVAFGGTVRVLQDFVTADNFAVPALEAGGLTPLAGAVLKGLDMVEERKQRYKANGVAYYRPWVFLITDGASEGEPAGLLNQAAQRIRAEEAAKRIAFFAVAVEGADMAQLTALTPRPPLKLKGLHFVELFVWLSHSTQQVANSRVGDQVALPPVDWGTV